MTTKKSNGGCKLKTPYGDLIVNEEGEVFQNGKQLTQSTTQGSRQEQL